MQGFNSGGPLCVLVLPSPPSFSARWMGVEQGWGHPDCAAWPRKQEGSLVARILWGRPLFQEAAKVSGPAPGPQVQASEARGSSPNQAARNLTRSRLLFKKPGQ